MASSLAQKLRIQDGMRIFPLHAPPQFLDTLGPVSGLTLTKSAANADQIHWFVQTRAQMEEELGEVKSWLRGETVCWIYYPKGSSGMQTDLTRDTGWDTLLRHNDLQWLSLISFDATWSAFGIRRKNEADKKKEARPKERPVFDYVDPVTKTVHLPEDLASLLKQHPAETAFFNTLSFTNKKEYIEWIVTAKREETRTTRVRETVERLGKGWKNPANR